MATPIENPAKCEVRSVIRFLNAQNIRPIEIYRQIKDVYGDNAMNESSVRKWCIMFNQGRTSVHDEERSGRPSLVTEELKKKVDDRIQENRRFTLTTLNDFFPQISRSLLHEIVTEHLGYKKMCARWIPKVLAEVHKTKRMGAALDLLTQYDRYGDQFLDRIVTGDETWVSYKTPETKRQSMEWHHSNSPSKPTKEKPNLNTRKLMATVFWDRKGLIHIEFMPRGETINSAAYCETLQRLKRAIQNKRRGMLSAKVFLIHDNARPHASARTQEELQRLKWEIFGHPPYSPDLAPSDYHLFPKLKEFLGGKQFDNDEELKEAVISWLRSLAVEEYNTGIEKLIPRYKKCLDNQGNYIEK